MTKMPKSVKEALQNQELALLIDHFCESPMTSSSVTIPMDCSWLRTFLWRLQLVITTIKLSTSRFVFNKHSARLRICFSKVANSLTDTHCSLVFKCRTSHVNEIIVLFFPIHLQIASLKADWSNLFPIPIMCGRH